ncbi:hypothetical protein [Candidatus Tisiphia endosymbiont of Ditula angustiorana]|uniref:hypothetical protein n=1 Tax=Candidatus Tisiphia endosymbiont of Ditula angustiorana TaxID=3066272 RepID=UPI00312C9DD0
MFIRSPWKTQEKFLKEFNHKPIIQHIQHTKKFFNKEKVKLKDEVEIEAICKVLDIATLLEKFNLNIRDILKTAGISPDICDKLDKDYTIKQALQCLEKWNNELTTGNNDPNTPSPTKSKVLTEAHDQLVSRYSASIKELQAKNNDPNTPSPTNSKVLTESVHDQLVSRYSAPIKELQAKMKKNDSQESGYSGSFSDELTNTSTISNKLPPCPPSRDYSKYKHNVDIANKYHDSDHHDTYYHPILGEHTDVSF